MSSKTEKKCMNQVLNWLLNSIFERSIFTDNQRTIRVPKMKAKVSFLLWSALFYSNKILAASTTGQHMPWESPLTAIVDSLTGPVARIGGVMAIAGAGLMLAMNQSEGFSRTAIRIVFGLTIAFSASTWGIKLFGFGSGLLLP